MGRELTDMEIDRKFNGVALILDDASLDKVCIPPKVSEDCMENSFMEEYNDKQEVLVSGKAKPSAVRIPCSQQAVPKQFALATGKRATRRAGALPHTDTNHSPDAEDTIKDPLKDSTPNSPPASKKLPQPDEDKHLDEEDNFSIASSNATSVRTAKSTKSKVTVGAAPTFKSTERAEKRKEFYSKLEEKHQALEAERSQFEARIKEEEATAIKELRKSMVFKANPVPSFYYEGPPPKAELKKLPLTRPKSPKLSHRKSFNDASYEERARASSPGLRLSIGPGSPRGGQSVTSPMSKNNNTTTRLGKGSCKS